MVASPPSPSHSALGSITVAAPSKLPLKLPPKLPSPVPPSSTIPVKRPLESSTSSITAASASASASASAPKSSSTTTTTTTTTKAATTTPATAGIGGFQTSSASSASSSSSSAAVPSSLSTPPTKKVLERNQACLSCRSRKRKCDGGKPTCGACERLERRCIYSSGGLSTVTKIHSSSSFHAQKTNTPPSRWLATPSSSSATTTNNAVTEDARTLPIHGPPPPPRTVETLSPSVLTAQSQSNGSAAINSLSTFTPINRGSTSPTAAINSHPNNNNHHNHNHNHNPNHNPNHRNHQPPQQNHHNGRSPYEPPPKRQAIAAETPGFDSSLFTAQFLQASPLVGLDTIDHSSWSEMGMVHGFYNEGWPKRGHSPRPENAGAAMAYMGDGMRVADDLPPPEALAELVGLFFSQIHPLVPCLYRKQVFVDIAPGGPLCRPCPLTYSMMALASYIHPDPILHDRSIRWHAAAKRGFDLAVTRGQYSLHNVQASIYICLYGFVTSEMSELWVFLAKAYRMCNPLGLHQIDSPRRNRFTGFLPHPKSEQDLEERRRAAWGIYVLNSFLSYSTGWPLLINDRDFCVNFPVDEDVFQSGEIERMSHIVVEPFAHNLEDLITPIIASAPVRGPYHYICKLAVLLGRIVAYNNSPIPATDTQEFESLETTLARFRLSLPRKYRGIVGLNAKDVTHVTQLNLLLHVCTILLHHPTVPVYPPQQDRPDNRESPSSSSAIDEGLVEPPAFIRCLGAVNNILGLLKTVINAAEPSSSLVDIDALQNPFITSALFLSARILTVRWLENGKDKATRAEIDLVLAVFERLKECWPELAGRYKELVMCDLRRERESVGGIKSGAGGYMGNECAPIYVGGV